MWMLGSGPFERSVCELYSCYCDSSKSMEGDHGKNRLPRCLLTSFQNGAQHKFFFQEKKFCKQVGKLDYSRYSQSIFINH